MVSNQMLNMSLQFGAAHIAFHRSKKSISPAYRDAKRHEEQRPHRHDSSTESPNRTTTQTHPTLAQYLSRHSHGNVHHYLIRASSECKHTRIESPSRRQQHTAIGIPNLSLNESKTGAATTACAIRQRRINNSVKQCFDSATAFVELQLDHRPFTFNEASVSCRR